MANDFGALRLERGGLIDRSRPLRFRFDGRAYVGFLGDTLASALLAQGIKRVGRSFKYHRPRGIYTAGPEEPNALVTLRTGARREPNLRATQIELFDGLEAFSQNCWPSLAFDVRAVNQWFSALLPAGFYYKTFMWPQRAWLWYEQHIRRAAGLGVAPTQPDPDRYETRFAHCDVLVVGGGAAGLDAACAAAQRGDRVILVDERAQLGGALRWATAGPDDMRPGDRLAARLADLARCAHVRVLTRTTAFGVYDEAMVNLLERVHDHEAQCPPFQPRQRLWQVRARRIVLATGAIERPLVFPDNDRPGVMLAGAVRAYLGEQAVVAGRQAVVFTNNDDAWETAFALRAQGAQATVVDTRHSPPQRLASAARDAGIEVRSGALITAVRGRHAVTGAHITGRDGTPLGDVRCDLIATSGGWSPTVHLWSQAGGSLRWDDGLAAFVPERCPQAIECVGAAAGDFTEPYSMEPFWAVGHSVAKGKRFVDLQDDVSVDDIELAHRENYSSVEHLKRYTTLGMGTDQGKTSNVNGLALLAGLRGLPIPEVGTTTFRPPYTPIAMGAMVGLETDAHAQPHRHTPLHAWHVAQGATLQSVGPWMRPRVYPRPGESFRDAWWRESLLVRQHVGLIDVSTLGKIDVRGPDAGAFLHRIYCNNVLSLPVGRVRYGLMLREDGLVADDGTFARLAQDHYYVTTTTAQAARVLRHMEFLLQWAWPEMQAGVTSVTDQYAQFALAGPYARQTLAALLGGVDVSDAALPAQGVLQARLGPAALMVFRVSFSGERAYEIAVEAGYAQSVWEALLKAGAPWGVGVYGTEAMGVLRIEKGHVASAELDGRVSAADLGLARLLRKDRAFVGGALVDRPGVADPDRPTLVGLVPVEPQAVIRAGSILVAADADAHSPHKLGWVSSATPSPTLGHAIALGFLARGAQRLGQVIHAFSPLVGERVAVRVTPAHHVDPSGERMKA